MLWRIWKVRNNRCLNGKKWEPGDVFKKAATDEEEDDQARHQEMAHGEEDNVMDTAKLRTQKCLPPQLFFKLNFDGAWIEECTGDVVAKYAPSVDDFDVSSYWLEDPPS
ncbi:hypothetical protein L1049_010371 [Liquidambar formosana]|uniref:Uncharacterized protein n=1 Tax=Liquidambar formosana TaxID=63359 RepID=A0AAP0NBD2_LIQFO